MSCTAFQVCHKLRAELPNETTLYSGCLSSSVGYQIRCHPMARWVCSSDRGRPLLCTSAPQKPEDSFPFDRVESPVIVQLRPSLRTSGPVAVKPVCVYLPPPTRGLNLQGSLYVLARLRASQQKGVCARSPVLLVLVRDRHSSCAALGTVEVRLYCSAAYRGQADHR